MMIFFKKSFFWKRLVMSGSSVSGDLQTFALRFGNGGRGTGIGPRDCFFNCFFMKRLIEILNDPHKGGQIIVPRRLLEEMFRNTECFPEAEACLYILVSCAFADGPAGMRPRRGQMISTGRGLARRFGWSISRTRRFLDRLVKAGVVSMEVSPSDGTLLTCMRYEQVCSFRQKDRCTEVVEPAVMDDESRKDFLRFWEQYHRRSGLIPHDVSLAGQVWMERPPEERRMAVERMGQYLMSVSGPEHLRSGLNYLRCKSYFF